MESLTLVQAWDQAAGALENDAMRPTRYARCLRYLVPDLPRESRILEVGCGEGSGLRCLQQVGYRRLTGVEVSPERIRRAQARLGSDVSLQVISPTQALPFPDEAFDAVLTAAVIEHSLDVPSFVHQIARVTRSGGSIVISSDCFMWRILQILGIYRSEQPVDRAIFPTRLIRLFEDAGLCLLHADAFAMPGNEYRFLRSLGRFCLRRPKPLARGRRLDPEPDTAMPRWQPRHWFWSFPKLLFSDENVFFLRKR